MKTNLKEINSYTRQLDISISWSLIEKDYINEFKKASTDIKKEVENAVNTEDKK